MRSLLAFIIVLVIGLDAQAGLLSRLKARRAAKSCAPAAATCSTPATVAVPPVVVIPKK